VAFAISVGLPGSGGCVGSSVAVLQPLNKSANSNTPVMSRSKRRFILFPPKNLTVTTGISLKYFEYYEEVLFDPPFSHPASF
jgi:hypothetical protein